MPSFRAPRSQSKHAVSQKIALGKGRHDHRNDGQIHSVGTARGYGQALKGVATYQQEHHLGDLRTVTIEIARQYLAERAALVSQKTLDLDRQALHQFVGNSPVRVDPSRPVIHSERRDANALLRLTTCSDHFESKRL